MKEYRETMHKTGERGEWKLDAPVPNREYAREEEVWSKGFGKIFCAPEGSSNNS